MLKVFGLCSDSDKVRKRSDGVASFIFTILPIESLNVVWADINRCITANVDNI